MEIFGRVDSLKKVIEKKFSDKIRAIEKDTEKQIDAIKKDAEKKIALLKARMKTETDSEMKKAYSKIMSEEKLKARKAFEEKREKLIDELFREIEKQAKKVAHSNEYIDYVTARKPKEVDEIITDSDFYKEYFGNLSIDKNIVGIKFKAANVVYDFTLDSALRMRREELRHTISNVLFKVE